MTNMSSRMQSRMSSSRLQYLTDDEEDETEEEKSFRPKIAIEISKRRCTINRPTCFSDQAGTMMEEVMPARELSKQYITSVTMSREVQAVMPQGKAEVNTARTSTTSTGMEHTEGGWPREVDHKDTDQASRYRSQAANSNNLQVPKDN